MIRLARLLSGLTASVVAACAAVPSDLGREQTIEATQALAKWFECWECGPRELNAVARFGQAVVPSLTATLNGGLSLATRETYRRYYANRYDELEKQGKEDPRFKMTSTKDQFVALYLDGMDSRYRIRAAQALGAIGGAEARKALEAALQSVKRAEVRSAIEDSLKAIK